MIKNKENGFIGKAVISLIATLGTLALFMGTSGASADVKESQNKRIYKQLYKTHPNKQLILKMRTSHLDI